MADDTTTTTDTSGPKSAPKGRRWALIDAVQEHHYAGKVSPELVAALQANNGKAILARTRSVITDEFGTREDIWHVAPELDMPGALPGEWRKVLLVDIEDN